MAQKQHSASAARQRSRMRPLQLTDAQMIQMDDALYMGDAQKQFFRERLLALEDMLVARSRETAAEIAVAAAGADPIDRASAEEEHQLAIAGRARDSQQLLEVRAALRRIDTDDFGFCLETGEAIGVGRLLVCPTTTLCVEAQQRRENQTSRYRS